MNAELIGPEDPRWRRVLEHVPHDTYHLPEYVACAAVHEGGVPAAVYAETGGAAFLAPLLIRRLPADLDAPDAWCDAASPYGYPGPLATDPADRASLAAFLAAWGDLGRARSLVSAFVRLHPLLSPPPDTFEPAGQVERTGRIVYVDLTKSVEQMWSETRSNHRTDVQQLRRAGFDTRMNAPDDYDTFKRLYRETMTRVGATSFYFFSDAYFEDLRRALGDRLHLCSVVSPAGDVAAAILLFVTGSIVQYHLGATAEAYLRNAPSKLAFDAARRWGAERGCRVLCLGGGLGGREDSLFHFKAGFAPQRAEFATVRMALDPEKYATLVARHPAADGQASTFFPEYRRPVEVRA